MDVENPVDVEIFADEIDANVAARAFNSIFSLARALPSSNTTHAGGLSGFLNIARGSLAPKTEAAV